MATKTFDIIFEGSGTSSGKMRNDISATWPDMNEHFELATDEGPFHGGDGTAPPPLALFTAALTGCLMTQIRAFAKRLNIELKNIDVNAKLHWQGEQIDNQPYVSRPVAFQLDVNIDSTATNEQLIQLLAAAKQGCFIEQSLTLGTTIKHRLKTAAGWIDA